MISSNPILEILYDRCGGYCLPDELAAAGGLARKDLELHLEELIHRGHALEFSPAQGVRLPRPCRLDAGLIERGLGTIRLGPNVICFGEVGSTNDVAMDSARQAGADGLVVLAECQRAGRGRLGRRWISPPAASVLMSVLLTDDGRGGVPPHDALTIAGGLAVAEAIEETSGVDCQIKWPNDVLHDGKKLAGVLVELRRQGPLRCAVLGVGVNVLAHPPDDQVDRPATSILAAAGEGVERIELVRGMLRRLDDWLARLAGGEVEALRAAWVARCGMINQRVSVSCSGEIFVGRMLDVSPLEGLILLCDDGRRVHLPAGSSTVLP